MTRSHLDDVQESFLHRLLATLVTVVTLALTLPTATTAAHAAPTSSPVVSASDLGKGWTQDQGFAQHSLKPCAARELPPVGSPCAGSSKFFESAVLALAVELAAQYLNNRGGIRPTTRPKLHMQYPRWIKVEGCAS